MSRQRRPSRHSSTDVAGRDVRVGDWVRVMSVPDSISRMPAPLSRPSRVRSARPFRLKRSTNWVALNDRFHEEGESAKSTHRSQLQALLTFCRLNKGRVHFVVVFNLTGFSRDKYDHLALRSHVVARPLAAV